MFWDNFVELCIKKGQSPNSVCDALGYSTAVATKWKRGSIPRDTTVRKIADYFDVSVDYLISEQKETPTVSDGLDDEILMLYSQLPPDKRKQADDYLRFLVQNSKNGES